MHENTQGAATRAEDIGREIERLKHRHEFLASLIEDQACNSDYVQVHGWGLYETHIEAARTLKTIQASCDDLREFIVNHPSVE